MTLRKSEYISKDFCLLVMARLSKCLQSLSEMNTWQSPNAGTFCINIGGLSATLAGKCLNQNSHVIKNSLPHFGVIYEGAAFFFSPVCVGV